MDTRQLLSEAYYKWESAGCRGAAIIKMHPATKWKLFTEEILHLSPQGEIKVFGLEVKEDSRMTPDTFQIESA